MNSIIKINRYGTKFWVIPNTENHELSFFDYGILHNQNGPAIEFNSGSKSWYINGLRHREDGPAIESNDGNKEWHINGLRHREDGPAIEYNDDYISWYLKDKPIKPTYEMMEKYIRSNPDNILKDWKYPLNIQVLAIHLNPGVIFNIKYPHKKLKQLFPKLYTLKTSGLI